MRIALIGRSTCNVEVIETLNEKDFDLVIGLGDVVCPNLLERFLGIIGEMEDVYIQKFLRSNHLILNRREDLGISSDFTTDVVITHLPPRGSKTGVIGGVRVGSSRIASMVISLSPRLLFHSHSEVQGIDSIGSTLVVSIGALDEGDYTVYYPKTGEFEFHKIGQIKTSQD